MQRITQQFQFLVTLKKIHGNERFVLSCCIWAEEAEQAQAREGDGERSPPRSPGLCSPFLLPWWAVLFDFGLRIEILGYL
ncbi:Protein of unknown function [Pyronema omphalodes CBS 100304]|uniref:Uncharacterized protein n=1 Tax=Pyronema omphalodes (strain CBS 100304) TaxID=1076935 RepID=U4L7L9_PYROM|nr:Protein of unknown function [Pyronema omphalodes CBS 100304]